MKINWFCKRKNKNIVNQKILIKFSINKILDSAEIDQCSRCRQKTFRKSMLHFNQRQCFHCGKLYETMSKIELIKLIREEIK